MIDDILKREFGHLQKILILSGNHAVKTLGENVPAL